MVYSRVLANLCREHPQPVNTGWEDLWWALSVCAPIIRTWSRGRFNLFSTGLRLWGPRMAALTSIACSLSTSLTQGFLCSLQRAVGETKLFTSGVSRYPLDGH